MTGLWVYRGRNVHMCPKPAFDEETLPGDRWRCSCGRIWLVVNNQLDDLYLSPAIQLVDGKWVPAHMEDGKLVPDV